MSAVLCYEISILIFRTLADAIILCDSTDVIPNRLSGEESAGPRSARLRDVVQNTPEIVILRRLQPSKDLCISHILYIAFVPSRRDSVVFCRRTQHFRAGLSSFRSSGAGLAFSYDLRKIGDGGKLP